MAEIEVFRARNTTGLAINGTRVTKTKPYGLIQITQKFEANDEEITKALSIDVQPLSVVAEHIKSRLYETALNTDEAVARDAIADMAERIDFWIDELKGGNTNG